jgi:hypothetical protein
MKRLVPNQSRAYQRGISAAAPNLVPQKFCDAPVGSWPRQGCGFFGDPCGILRPRVLTGNEPVPGDATATSLGLPKNHQPPAYLWRPFGMWGWGSERSSGESSARCLVWIEPPSRQAGLDAQVNPVHLRSQRRHGSQTLDGVPWFLWRPWRFGGSSPESTPYSAPWRATFKRLLAALRCGARVLRPDRLDLRFRRNLCP